MLGMLGGAKKVGGMGRMGIMGRMGRMGIMGITGAPQHPQHPHPPHWGESGGHGEDNGDNGEDGDNGDNWRPPPVIFATFRPWPKFQCGFWFPQNFTYKIIIGFPYSVFHVNFLVIFDWPRLDFLVNCPTPEPFSFLHQSIHDPRHGSTATRRLLARILPEFHSHPQV
jgi:hypothetical protein